MTTSYGDGRIVLHEGDCIDVLRELADDSVDSIVTDPPYGLGFMGKAWDELPPGLPWAQECLRVLKPGGHLLAFGGTRTWHRLAVAVEDAGFEVRDSIAWLYGSGFPKSLDVSKAIDKLDAADERRTRALTFTAWMRSTGITSAQINETTGTNMGGHYLTEAAQPAVAVVDLFDLLRPLLPEVPAEIEQLVAERTVESANYAQRPDAAYASRPGMAESWTEGSGWTGTAAKGGTGVTEDARAWQGWGTALKPAFEPIVVARKPLVGTVAANVLAHGTGALNVDGCRLPTTDKWAASGVQSAVSTALSGGADGSLSVSVSSTHEAGRWPANVVLDEDQAAALDEQSGTTTSKRADRGGGKGATATFGVYGDSAEPVRGHDDSGGASRFFYVAKAPTKERIKVDGVAHPTVKPLTLMRWLVRLVTPPGGLVLEPFAGSGTTLEAVALEGFRAIGVEREATYLPLIAARMERVGLALDGAPEVEPDVVAVTFGTPAPVELTADCPRCGADLDAYPHGACYFYEIEAA